MRVLGFSKKWEKLEQDTFTTFRIPRKDRDWQIGEIVQVVYHPRSKNREKLGIAAITNKEPKWTYEITDQEAIEDGFPCGGPEMQKWFLKTHGDRLSHARLNKLTLKWLKLF